MMTEQAGSSAFGTLGLDVGVFARWSRLVWGLLLLIPIVYAVITSDLLDSRAFYLQAVVYLVGITAAYLLVYWAFGERFFATANPWVNTAIFVGPAFMVGWWPIIVAPVTGVELPDALVLAMGIGISFILQWRIELATYSERPPKITDSRSRFVRIEP